MATTRLRTSQLQHLVLQKQNLLFLVALFQLWDQTLSKRWLRVNIVWGRALTANILLVLVFIGFVIWTSAARIHRCCRGGWHFWLLTPILLLLALLLLLLLLYWLVLLKVLLRLLLRHILKSLLWLELVEIATPSHIVSFVLKVFFNLSLIFERVLLVSIFSKKVLFNFSLVEKGRRLH